MTATQEPKDLEKLLKEVENWRETAKWKMELAKSARAYFTGEYMKEKEEYIKYDKLYKLIKGKE